ncbi:MAG: DNA-binding protein, partial [Undibacterium sp.]|nr:DNA-binding protein [Undibacterium sp.]
VLVPVLWGEKKQHQNAMHIHLPEEKVTFIFLNLDTSIEDFKFWMAHELAHVYTPALVGTEEGEDFADAFAGVLLFPNTCAQIAYQDVIRARTAHGKIVALQKHATHHSISLFTVYKQVEGYARHLQLPSIGVDEKSIHIARNKVSKQLPLVSEALFDPLPPPPSKYIAAVDNGFQSDFFRALRVMINERGMGAGYIKQILDISLADATALHSELTS